MDAKYSYCFNASDDLLRSIDLSRPPYVFISYSSADNEFARKLMSALEAHRVSCWYELRDLAGLNLLETEICNAILHAKIFVVLISSKSIASKWVLSEVQLAIKLQKTIIPIRIDSTPLYDGNNGLLFYLSGHSYMDLSSNFDNSIDMAAEKIRRLMLVNLSKSDQQCGGSDVKNSTKALATETKVLHLLAKLDAGKQLKRQDRSFLKKITKLDFRQCILTAIPGSIREMTGLESLNLAGTQISEIPDSIGELNKLVSLNLASTRITELPETVRRLICLRDLNLRSTWITRLPEWLGDLPALQKLDLAWLILPELPKSLALRRFSYTEDEIFQATGPCINLFNLYLTRQDRTIFLEHPELIPSLYREEAFVSLRECRVIFLGDGAAGKSYTIRRFREDGKRETKRRPYVTSETPGVDILDYHVNHGVKSFDIHFWDFGGQQVLHSMHRCFLTEETCYVVMVKTRDTTATERATYWLRNVKAFAPNSRVLLFVNCWDNDDGRSSIDEPGLLARFPNIQKVIYCSAKQAEDAEFHRNVMTPIIEMAAASDGISKTVPRSWASIRESLRSESIQDNYLTKERYHALCTENHIENETAPELLSFFNKLGICFSYHRDQEKHELADYKLLRPVWLTNAIYSVIEEGKVFAREGCISRNAVRQLLCNEAPSEVQGRRYRRTVPELQYKPEECPYILEVAIANDLCYPVDNCSLFFPALCGSDTPAEALSEPTGFNHHISYLLRYEYLPDSVLHKFMICCMKNALSVESRWMRGMILSIWTLHRILVHMADDESLKIDIWSTGEHRAYELFWFIRKHIEEINKLLNLESEEYIVDGNAEFLLEDVITAARDNANMYGRGRKINARKLLGEFYEESFAQSVKVSAGTIQIPIAPRTFHSCPKSNVALRYALYYAYNKICPYCNDAITNLRELEVDHIFPTEYKDSPSIKSYTSYLESCGFDTEKPDYIENYFPAHSYCNKAKSNRVNEFSLPYWHDLAAMRTPTVLRLMARYKVKEGEG